MKAHLQARLRVGLQKHRQHGLPGVTRFLSALSCQLVHFVVPKHLPAWRANRNPVSPDLRHPIFSANRNGFIRKANGAEFLKAHLQARLRVGLQKQRQHGLPGVTRFFSALSCHFVHFVVQIRELTAPIAAPGGAQSLPALRLSAPSPSGNSKVAPDAHPPIPSPP